MKNIKIYAVLFFGFFYFLPAHATGEVVTNCSPYGPTGTVIPGWAIIQMRNDLSCFSTRFTWQNLNGSPYGARATVCGLNDLPNWWPVSYRSNIGGPCKNGGEYYYVIEYRGN